MDDSEDPTRSVTVNGDTPLLGGGRDDQDLTGSGNLGRYILLQRLASGGMGVVYVAYDPELDRKVALKLVRSDVPSDALARIVRARFVREAQAMAKVSHPNVVPIYDVALLGDRVFLAMELVEGQNGRSWLQTAHPSPKEALAMYLQAGRGLAAAHAAGFVHRDFKPENLLIGKDGRPRVTDFGLVRAGEDEDPSDAPRADTEAASPESALETAGALVLTRADAVLGTPQYMAPEQFEGKQVGPRTDQFAFCVAVYEALYGERPFAGATAAELRRAVLEGQVRPPKSRSGVKWWVRRALLRGLARTPEERWPSMDALLTALETDPSARYRKLGLAFAVLALVVGGVVVGRQVEERARGICSGGPARLAGVWDASAADAVDAALRKLDPARGGETARRVRAALDGYTDAWSSMFREACEATRVRREQPEEHLALRVECLEDRRRDLRALVEALSSPKALAPDRALEATTFLPSIAACGDVPTLLAPTQLPPDPGLRASVVAVRETLARARSERATGRWRDAQVTVDDALERARRTGFEPLVVECLYLRGNILDMNGEIGASEAALVDALEGALRVRHERFIGASLVELAWVAGYQSGRLDEGLRLARFARAALLRLRDADDLEAQLDSYVGSILMRAGRIPEAITEFKKGLARTERLRGPRSLEAGRLHLNIANAHLFADELAEARAEYQNALDIEAEALGTEHPHIGQVYLNLGELHFSSGDVPASLEAYRRAIALWTRSLGPSYVKLGLAHAGASRALLALGSLEEAEAEAQRSVDVYAAQEDGLLVGGRHALDALAQTRMARGRYREAIPLLERALGLADLEPADRDGRGDLLFLLARSYGEGAIDPNKALAFAEKALNAYASNEPARAKVQAWLDARSKRADRRP
jgi:tetratricopeptide (TPR) repeat protein